MKYMTIDGNEACARSAYMFTEVAGIYPITPSSTMAELVDDWSNKGEKNIFNDTVKVIEMQSEGGAAGLVHGSLEAGCLTTTFTASQGLLLMIPNMYKMSGELLPAVFHVAARSLSTHALSIFGDHQDIYSVRSTGFCMLASSSVEDAGLLSIVAHLSSIKASLPFLHFFDGFRTSHEINKVKVLDKEDVIKYLDKDALNKFRERALNPLHPVTRGTSQNGDVYFQNTEARNKYYDEVADIVNDYMDKIGKEASTSYKPFNYYGSKDATNIIVAMGSVCETIKEVIDDLNTKGYNVGLIEVHLYRPFSKKYLLDVLPKTVKNIAVLDRTKEPGSLGEPLYLDVVNALKELNLTIIGGRYGLSSKNTTPSQIKAVYDNLNGTFKNNFTIGIEDDVTNLSLDTDKSYKLGSSSEIIIYGYGSDGMVSASKSIMKIVGESSNKYVQGYFDYDSKKSGGVTVCNLRFDKDKIRSTYFVENPSIVVCTKDSYLTKYDMLSNIKEKGIFILNTSKKEEEVFNLLSKNDIEIINSRKIKVYIINAYELASKVGLGNKISTIMESILFYLTKLIPYDKARKEMKDYAKKRYFKKGENVIKANYKAIEGAKELLKKANVPLYGTREESISNDFYSMVDSRKGSLLPVSAFLKSADGVYEAGTSKKDKRGVSEVVPNFIKENCISCNMCSMYCPHGVIRPFLITEKEYNNLPTSIKDRCKDIPDLKGYKYTIGISIKDCTGCGVCIKNCPKSGKALSFINYDKALKNKEQEIFDYLDKHIGYKEVGDNVKNIQFNEPKFAFSGACAGCGETPYLKLLTQIFGKSMIVCNATGCSSIYSSSTPSNPYTVPWTSSLFEDNAEFGYGVLIANKTIKSRIKTIMENNMDNPNSKLFKKWIKNVDNFDITKEVYDNLDYKTCPKEIVNLKDYLLKRSIWTIGGDGWAYDIGYGGIDHILASDEDINILVLDSQVYSNTGGQSSKSSPKGTIASFTSIGKNQNKKDLASVCMAYPHVYVGTISLGANPAQALKVFKEAESYKGPSIIIAYTPCISHGIKGGMSNSIGMEKLATESGYFPIFRRHPLYGFTLDSKNVNFDKYSEFLESQTRYSMLKVVNPSKAKTLINQNKEFAINRYNYYKKLDEEKGN